MTATAEILRDLHLLHQRAKALRDRLASAPRTLAARQAALASRQADLEKARKALQDAKVQLKKHEHALQAQQAKIDDLKVKLNQVKKNEEYKALQNQIAHDKAAMSKTEDEILQSYERSKRRASPSPSSRRRSSRSPRTSLAMQTGDRIAGLRPQGPASGAGNGHHRSRDLHSRGGARTLQPHRPPVRCRCPGCL